MSTKSKFVKLFVNILLVFCIIALRTCCFISLFHCGYVVLFHHSLSIVLLYFIISLWLIWCKTTYYCEYIIVNMLIVTQNSSQWNNEIKFHYFIVNILFHFIISLWTFVSFYYFILKILLYFIQLPFRSISINISYYRF